MSLDWTVIAITTVLAFLASDIWRWSSVFLSLSFKEDDEIVVFARMVATAVLAGVVAKLLFFPPGELATIPFWIRMSAMAIGMAAFVLRGKSIFAAILAGQAALIVLGLLSA
jgi:Branched-chain amino acid transport protein (AzlD)